MKLKGAGGFVRVVAFIVGLFLVIAGGFSLGLTTIPGVALIIWSLTGYGLKGK